MERADISYLSRELLKYSLHLCSVFSYYIGIVSSCLIHEAIPIVKLIIKYPTVKCPKGAEGICGEEHLVSLIIGKHNLRPVNHRCHNELKVVLSCGYSVTFVHKDKVLSHIHVVELGYKPRCLFVAYYL